MNKFKRKLLLLTLMSSLTGLFSSCAREDALAGPNDKRPEDETTNKVVQEEFIENSGITTSEDIDITETEITLPPESIVTESTEVSEETTLPTESVTEEIPPVTEEVIIPEEKNEEYIYNTITATSNVNVRREPVSGDILALLPKGEKLGVLDYQDNWYKVIYNGQEAYVSGDYAVISEDQVLSIPEDFEPNIYEYDVIVASANVNIRKSPVDGKVVGVLPLGKKLTLLEEVDGWYKVLYYGEECYVSANYSYPSTSFTIGGDRTKIFYATDELTIYIPYEINQNGEVALINALECLEVYGETEDLYLVKTNDYVGYVKKHSLRELCGTFVVVDISDQNLKLYVDNQIIVDTPVVTGKKGTPSDIGLFDVDGIDYHRYLKGVGYKTWVDVFAYYNGGEGLHDAEYHKCDKGGNHGWRSASEFGGETYINNGSHGCINMLHEDVMEVVEHIEVGTPVLVKK